MPYRCQTCRATVPAGCARLTHVVKRADGSHTRELAVCALCWAVLNPGEPLPAVTTPATPPQSNQIGNTNIIPTGDE